MRWLWLVLLLACRREPAPIRIATFNIEDFPKNPAQVRGAFSELVATHASIIGVQEIDDPALFARSAHEYFGAQWQFIPTGWTQPFPHSHHLGVLFDSARWRLVSTTLHPEPSLDGYGKPALEVRLAPVAGGDPIRVIVVHFVCCSDGLPARRRQHAALAQILAKLPRGDHTVVLGDFNATSDEDRTSIASLAGRLSWATEPLECSAFWRRADSCPRSRLDHVLTWKKPRAVEVLGACKREGCKAQDRCPIDATTVSDHCPVAITL